MGDPIKTTHIEKDLVPNRRLIVYGSLNKCMKAYFNDDIPLYKRQGQWEWADADGIKHSKSFQASLRAIRRRGYWGWAENKLNVHVWTKPGTQLDDLISLIGHELGHCVRPFYKSIFSEEQKAEKYATVALDAYELGKAVYNIVNV